mmetsp:Transcript_3398/g.5298  ORF Transcript_3398/g.5298 Transcript_3398/m.5298 type:complete len:309 (+) Transcript_3398:3-929(+)
MTPQKQPQSTQGPPQMPQIQMQQQIPQQFQPQMAYSNGAMPQFQPVNMMGGAGQPMLVQQGPHGGMILMQPPGPQFIAPNGLVQHQLVFDPRTGQTVLAPISVQGQQIQVIGNPALQSVMAASVALDQKPASSKFRGVSWHRRDRKWLARTWINGRIEHLGCFKSEEMAALAVDIRTLEHFGEDSRDLNFPDAKERESLKTKFQENGEFKLRPKEALMNPIPRSNRRSRMAAAAAAAAAVADTKSTDGTEPSESTVLTKRKFSSNDSDSESSDLTRKGSSSEGDLGAITKKVRVGGSPVSSSPAQLVA